MTCTWVLDPEAKRRELCGGPVAMVLTVVNVPMPAGSGVFFACFTHADPADEWVTDTYGAANVVKAVPA